MLLRKQESGDGMKSMDLPYVGEDEALSWFRRFIMQDSFCLLATTQHDTPLLKVYTGSLHLYTFSKRWSRVGDAEKRGKMKNPRHFDNIFRAFIPYFPVKSLSLGLWDLKLSHGNPPKGSSWSLNLSSALVAQPSLLLLPCMHL